MPYSLYINLQVANIIFLDSPVGAGFSYSNTSKGYPTSDSKAAQDNFTFLRKVIIINQTNKLSIFSKKLYATFVRMYNAVVVNSSRVYQESPFCCRRLLWRQNRSHGCSSCSTRYCSHLSVLKVFISFFF